GIDAGLGRNLPTGAGCAMQPEDGTSLRIAELGEPDLAIFADGDVAFQLRTRDSGNHAQSVALVVSAAVRLRKLGSPDPPPRVGPPPTARAPVSDEFRWLAASVPLGGGHEANREDRALQASRRWQTGVRSSCRGLGGAARVVADRRVRCRVRRPDG